jgi:hypothetical protein
MFDDRSSWVGIALLVLCGISAGIMLGYIDRGTLPVFSGSGWLKLVITAGGIGLFLWTFMHSRRNPWLGNDVRPAKRRWFSRDRNNQLIG